MLPSPGARRVSFLFLLALACAGCGTLPSGRGWGQDATWTPGWERVRAAAWKNAVDPWTWAPLAGAAVLQIGNMDQRISDWARDETPVFGSTQHAEDAAGTWRSASGDLWIASVLATQSGDSPAEWTLSKLKGAFVEVSRRVRDAP